MSAPSARRPRERGDPYAVPLVCRSVAIVVNSLAPVVMVPARAEPVIGRRFAPTRWLGRDDGCC